MTEEQSSPADNPPLNPEQAGTPETAAQPAENHGHSSHTTAFHSHRTPVCASSILWVLFFLALTAAARIANYQRIIVPAAGGAPRQIFYEDGDCYARMTRVREILQGWGAVHYHLWENYPKGIWSHTTAPMDYFIAAIALLLRPFMVDSIDMAGAVAAPLLGVMTTAFLALWARELNQQYRKLMLLLASLSPILVHGTALGRPDHHPLQIFLLAVGIGAELIMARAPCVSWGIVSGAAWGLALWVSLYEPLVLFLVIYTTKFIFYRPKLFVKERLWGFGVLLAVLGVAYGLDGRYLIMSFGRQFDLLQPQWLYQLDGQFLSRCFGIQPDDAAMRTYLGNWLATIEEMGGMHSEWLNIQGMNIFSAILYRWVGFGLLTAPILLIARLRDTKRSTLLLALLAVTFCLTLTELRWGYFFALIYVMSLPWQLSLFKRKWLVWTLFLLSLWPVAREWDDMLFSQTYADAATAQLNDQRRLRQAADYIKVHGEWGGILAPWWWSPQLAYWSGRPAVAGSSHESLPGIVDTARFFSTADPNEAEAICKQRDVTTVVSGNPGTILEQSVQILGQPLPEKENTMADILWIRPHSAPPFVHIVFDNTVMKVFDVGAAPAGMR